ncbi:ankyrin repeats (many copies) domain-containing protein [Ditylenchus destructor]|uniref:Ankyrin repeats (Many copies) domain-containing protein n=1 Tax=Ditylenchus destructor TaxID=166010 RepID=A0AAD4R1L8_9BILA|nr:ankyrin repeats (many copies) domain-containing protein [Ditylenchus destructor]
MICNELVYDSPKLNSAFEANLGLIRQIPTLSNSVQTFTTYTFCRVFPTTLRTRTPTNTISDFRVTEKSEDFGLVRVALPQPPSKNLIVLMASNWKTTDYPKRPYPKAQSAVKEPEMIFRRDPGASTVTSPAGYRFKDRRRSNHPVYTRDWVCTTTNCLASIFVTGQWEQDDQGEFRRGKLVREWHGRGRSHAPPADEPMEEEEQAANITAQPFQHHAVQVQPVAEAEDGAEDMAADMTALARGTRQRAATAPTAAAAAPNANNDAAGPSVTAETATERAADAKAAKPGPGTPQSPATPPPFSPANFEAEPPIAPAYEVDLVRQNEELQDRLQELQVELQVQAGNYDALETRHEKLTEEHADARGRARADCEAKLARFLDAEEAAQLRPENPPNDDARGNAVGGAGRQSDEAAAAKDLAEDLEPVDLLNWTHQVDESASSAEEAARTLGAEEAARHRALMQQSAAEAPFSFLTSQPDIAVPRVLERRGVRIRPEGVPDRRAQFLAAADEGNMGELQRMYDADQEFLQDGEVLGEALHRAADRCDVDVCKWLLSVGANPEWQRPDGWTALHRAARRANHEVVSMLLSHGALINSRANSLTPLQMAFNPAEDRARVRTTVQVLLDAPGIDLTATSDATDTPLMLAQRIDHDMAEMIQAMIESRLASA